MNRDHISLMVWRYSLSSFSSSNLHWWRQSQIHCFRDRVFMWIQRKLFWRSKVRWMRSSTPSAARLRRSESAILPSCAREPSSCCGTSEPSMKSFLINCNSREQILSFNNARDFSSSRMLLMACKARLRDWPKKYLVRVMLMEIWADLRGSGFVCSCTCAAHSARRTSSPTVHADNTMFASRFFCWQWYHRRYSQWPMPSRNFSSRKWIWLSMISTRRWYCSQRAN